MTSPNTQPGTRSSQSMAAIRGRDSIMPEWVPVPLVAEDMHVTGARRWIDSGMPDNTGNEYPGWR
jgi:hypothetical protein